MRARTLETERDRYKIRKETRLMTTLFAMNDSMAVRVLTKRKAIRNKLPRTKKQYEKKQKKSTTKWP